MLLPTVLRRMMHSILPLQAAYRSDAYILLDSPTLERLFWPAVRGVIGLAAGQLDAVVTAAATAGAAAGGRSHSHSRSPTAAAEPLRCNTVRECCA